MNLEIELSGEGAESLPRDATHLVVKALTLAHLHRLGFWHQRLLMTADNVNPHERGPGSSASAVVAAVSALRNALVPEESRRGRGLDPTADQRNGGPPGQRRPRHFRRAGHIMAGQRPVQQHLRNVARTVIPVVAVPDYELSTETARGLLPASVGHQAAAMNSGRAALLIHALTSTRNSCCRARKSTCTRAPRQAMRPSAELIAALRRPGSRRRRLRRRTHRHGPGQWANRSREGCGLHRATPRTTRPKSGWRVMKLAVDVEGAKVEVHRR